MTLNDFADICMLEIEIRRIPNQNNRWLAEFKHCEVKNGKYSAGLLGAYGEGTNPSVALFDYAKTIKGKIIVYRASSPDERREYGVPTTLETT